jgi:hypothetical protein
MSVQKLFKSVGVTVLVGVPLLFAAAIFLLALAYIIVIFIFGAPVPMGT